MKRPRRSWWSVLLMGLAACGDAPSEEAASDAAPPVAGACLGSADGMAHIAGGLAKVGCPAGDARCDEAPPANHRWLAMPETEIEVDDFAIDLVEVSAGEVMAWAETVDDIVIGSSGLFAFLYRGDEDVPYIGDPALGFRCAANL